MNIPVEVKDTIVVAVDSILKTSSQKGFWDIVLSVIQIIAVIAPFFAVWFAYKLGQKSKSRDIERNFIDQFEYLYYDYSNIFEQLEGLKINLGNRAYDFSRVPHPLQGWEKSYELTTSVTPPTLKRVGHHSPEKWQTGRLPGTSSPFRLVLSRRR